jgi:hypothetical protein
MSPPETSDAVNLSELMEIMDNDMELIQDCFNEFTTDWPAQYVELCGTWPPKMRLMRLLHWSRREKTMIWTQLIRNWRRLKPGASRWSNISGNSIHKRTHPLYQTDKPSFPRVGHGSYSGQFRHRGFFASQISRPK